jgi:SPP1 family predicted phage head-tail adaptor
VISAGSLDDRITIQTLTAASPNVSGSGMPDESWQTYASVAASVEPISGRELFSALERHAETTTRIKIRYRDGVTAKMRIVGSDGTIYEIERLLEYKRDGYMELLCTSGVTEG